MSNSSQSMAARSRPITRPLCGRIALLLAFVIGVIGCGGTTGREGLEAPAAPADAGASGNSTDAAKDVTITPGDDDDDAGPIDTGVPDLDDGATASDATEAGGACCSISAACNDCLQANCAPPTGSSSVPPCSTGSGVQGVATGGPGAGSARVDLCKAVYACVSQTRCGASNINECYCGTASGASCLNPGAANGPCKDAIERGLETTDPVAIATGFANTDLGGGVALELLSCTQQNGCWDACIAGAGGDAGARDGH
jgi:hypothetical protein